MWKCTSSRSSDESCLPYVIQAEKKRDAAAPTTTDVTPPGNDTVDHKPDQQEPQQHQHVEGASHLK